MPTEGNLDIAMESELEFKMDAPVRSAQPDPLATALDYIKELCDILDDPHIRNNQETIGNAYMNAMSFYSHQRPPKAAPVVRYENGEIVDDLPF